MIGVGIKTVTKVAKLLTKKKVKTEKETSWFLERSMARN
mgnify:CR=1 FL=1